MMHLRVKLFTFFLSVCLFLWGCNQNSEIEVVSQELHEQGYENYNSENYFPDPQFRLIIEKKLGNKPGEPFSKEDLETISDQFSCSYRKITSLNGIEYLPNITELNCSGNQLTELDLSQNQKLIKINFSSNQISQIDLSNNPSLEEVICDENQLESLDTSMLSQLRKLDCRKNKLTQLDIQNNPQLIFLGADENKLNSINVKNNPDLEELYLSINELAEIDLANNTKLVRLDIDANQFKNLPELNHLTKLETLDVRWNFLTCEDWDFIVQLKNKFIEKPEWGMREVDWGQSIRKGFAYSPQRNMDPFECE